MDGRLKNRKFAYINQNPFIITMNFRNLFLPFSLFIALYGYAEGTLTDPLDNSTWAQSQWISAVNAPVVDYELDWEGPNSRAADGASWFYSSVKNDKPVVSAKWMTAGLGVYDLYVNGKLIGKEVLKPGFTHYEKTKRSFTYDVTDALDTKAGAHNDFSAQVTPGWWADHIITPAGHKGMIGKKPAFRGVLELTFSDGSKKYYGTNTTGWYAGIAGPVKHASIFDGEEYDAREKMAYKKGKGFKKAELNNEFKGEILPTNGAEVYHREDLALSPVEAYLWKGVRGQKSDGNGVIDHGTIVKVRQFKSGETMVLKPGETLVIDFGQNAAAVPDFQFKAKKGTKLECLPGEILNDGNGAESRGMDGPEGSVHRRNLRAYNYGIRLDYTFGNSKDYVHYRPRATFFGYRYLSLTATGGDVEIKDVKSIPVTSITRDMEIGSITTGNELVNKLISNTRWGQLSNYLSVPTDCPQRNERLGWTADTQVFTETGSFFANTDRFFHKWTRDMRDTQSPTGGFPGVAPLAQYGANPTDMSRVGWADAGVIVPWVIWKQYGDTAIINENWAAMEKFVDHIAANKYRHDKLTDDNGNYQWADWLSYEPLESCGGGIDYTDKDGSRKHRPSAIEYWNYLCGCYWLIDAEYMLDMARATGRDTKKYEKMVAEARDYLKNEYLYADGTFKLEVLNTMQAPALFALRTNLVEGQPRKEMIERLRKNFAEHGNCLQTGFLGTSILMPTLSENGMSDIAYELLFQRKNPSWLYSIDNGATTIWERWNSYMKDKGMGPRGMNSFNHYAYGCVCEWMWETMAGIASDPKAPGFKRIIMKPMPDPRLGFVKAEYKSAAGPITSEWHYDDNGTWIWDFTIPQGSVAEVTLPGETESHEYGAGHHHIEK